MLSGDLLAIYLNDHLATATAGRDLARRAAGSNEGSDLGAFLEDLAAQIDADREQLIDLMGRLEVGRDCVKVGAGRLAEKLGRLKLNGRLLSYSPLSRVIELEGLAMGIRGKRALWRALAAAAPGDPRIRDVDFVHLAERADEQLAAVESHHTGAVVGMLAA